jgi:hypothetical protein
MEIILSTIFPHFILVVHPDNEERARESLADSKYKDQIELVVDENIPDGKAILINKEAAQWETTEQTRTPQWNNGEQSRRSSGGSSTD